jgi:hypothetical protein
MSLYPSDCSFFKVSKAKILGFPIPGYASSTMVPSKSIANFLLLFNMNVFFLNLAKISKFN